LFCRDIATSPPPSTTSTLDSGETAPDTASVDMTPSATAEEDLNHLQEDPPSPPPPPHPPPHPSHTPPPTPSTLSTRTPVARANTSFDCPDNLNGSLQTFSALSHPSKALTDNTPTSSSLPPIGGVNSEIVLQNSLCDSHVPVSL